MPIVKSSNLPTYDRLLSEGRHILDPSRAADQDIRPLHIGFCNLMPDAAMQATERQWFRLIGESNRVAQIYIHPFTLPAVERDAEATAYAQEHYENIEDIKSRGLDALIITGANLPISELFDCTDKWNALKEVYDWANENVVSTISSCFASHAYMAFHHNIRPTKFDNKILGVYPFRVLDRTHPLIRGMNTKMDICNSRYHNIPKKDYTDVGMSPLIEGKDIGVDFILSPDGLRNICIQGHPEYDLVSLLKEHRRDILLAKDNGQELPDAPVHYLPAEAQELVKKYLSGKIHDFPEKEIEALIDNTWTDSARSFMANWIGHVYQLTNVDRHKQFMDGVDPNNPLGL